MRLAELVDAAEREISSGWWWSRSLSHQPGYAGLGSRLLSAEFGGSGCGSLHTPSLAGHRLDSVRPCGDLRLRGLRRKESRPANMRL